MLTTRFEEALAEAAKLHRPQLRKGTTTPYISHLMAVAGLCLEHGADEDTAIAALFHDAIEDQGGDAARAVVVRYGDRVLAIVEACTDADTTPKPPWKERKLAHLAHLGAISPEARLVVVADKLHNARCLLLDYRAHGEALWSRFNTDKAGTIWYYRSMVERLRETGFQPALLVDELARTIETLADLSGAAPAQPMPGSPLRPAG